MQPVVAVFAALLIGGLSAAFSQRLRRARTERQLDAGRLTCALRVTSGSQHGLSARWRHVLAKVSPGQLDCRGQWYHPTAIGDFLVIEVGGPAVPPARKELWALSAQCRIVQIHTPTATLSWAVLDRHIDRALAQLTTSDSAGVSADG
jgi:hypothetical protein